MIEVIAISKLPLVSIVSPTFNQGRFLSETIESVLAQTYPNIEYLVIDDGSTDNTPEILKKYQSHLRYERQENIGQVRTLNKGWSISKGKYIGYLSTDDILYPNAISELVEILESNAEAVCAFPDSDLIDPYSKVIKRNVCRPFDLAETLITQECYIGPGAIFSKDAYDSLGGWRTDLKLGPDREFWIRLSSLGKILMCPSVLAGYRTHVESNIYREVSEEVTREYLTVLDDYFNSNTVSPEIASRRAEAYGYAYLTVARNVIRSGNLRRGIQLYGVACNHFPPLKSNKNKLALLRSVVSKPVRRIAWSLKSALRIR